MFKFLSRLWRLPTNSALNDAKLAIGINIVDDPDFDDYGPPPERLAEKLRGSNLIPPEIKEDVIATAPTYFRNGGGMASYLKSVKERHTKQPKAVYDEIRRIVLLETSRARTLHDLRRKEEAGITHCTFASARDERCTPLERKLQGKRMTIGQARRLVLEHSDEISRSNFRAEIKF